MRTTRRTFVAGSSASLVSLAAPGWLRAFGDTSTPNLFMVFNHIRNAEDGESDEFVTLEHIHRLIEAKGGRAGHTVIGIGARSGTAQDPYGQPGEMGYHWTYGTPWNGSVTSTVDASPVPFNLDDPITVTQVGVLDESSAHRFVLDGSELAGTVLWTMHEDETVRPVVGRGFHNTFSDVDGGMAETLFEISAAAKTGRPPNAEDRARLERFIPALADETIWTRFRQSLVKPVVAKDWHAYVKAQGWQGAAVVLKGSFSNVAQFHLREWNRKKPSDPIVRLGVGTHGPLRIQYGREIRPFIDTETAEWTMVGFLWDERASGATPPMGDLSRAIDIFGHDFHIHGFRDDGKHGGHTLFAMLGEGQIEVKLYPLSFTPNKSFFYNADLELLPETLQQEERGTLRIGVRNTSETFLRNVSAELSVKRSLLTFDGDTKETARIDLLEPGKTAWLVFDGPIARLSGVKRRLKLDEEGRFLEGGKGRANNDLEIGADLTWRWR